MCPECLNPVDVATYINNRDRKRNNRVLLRLFYVDLKTGLPIKVGFLFGVGGLVKKTKTN